MKKNSILIKIFALLCGIGILFSGVISVSAVPTDNSGAVPSDTYTYWYWYSGASKKSTFSRPMYEVNEAFRAQDFGLNNNFGQLTDSFCRDGFTYLLDGGASQIIVLDSDFKLQSVINAVSDSNNTQYSYENASGIFVSDKHEIYIADTENKRVLVTNEAGAYIREYTLPESEVIPDDFNFKPTKVALDSRGNMYVLSDGSYYGAILYNSKGEFSGFYGANQVKSSIKTLLQNIYNRIFSNDVKKAASERNIPYQFTDLYIDDKDFVYTATGNTNLDTESSAQSGQIKRLSAGGSNILKSESIDFGDTGISIESQNIVSVESDSNGFIYAVDSKYGHIFVFDSECTMVTAFGNGIGEGSQKGNFSFPSSLSLNGDKVIVTDKINQTVTVFRATEYGNQVLAAQQLTVQGHYSAAMPMWQEIIKQDSNNQLAYWGLAKGYYGEGNYKEAMRYAKIGCDRETYANAFEQVRNAVIKKYFAFAIIAIVAVIVIAVITVKHREKAKKEGFRIKNPRLRCYSSLLIHPADTFREIKEKKNGSVVIAAVLTLIYYVTSVMTVTNGGFAFVVFDSENFNSLFVLLQTVGLVVLFTISYWCVSTLFGGLGKIADIFVVTAYSFTPMIIGNIAYTVLTNLLVPNELGFLNIFMTIMSLYTVILLIIGMMRINDFEFKQFLLVTALSIVGMVVILFLIIVVVLLLQLTVGFFKTVISELLKLTR